MTDMQGNPYSAFSRSTLATNGVIHGDILQVIGPKTADLSKGGDLSPWFIPPGYNFVEE